ncbi:hypothetical protein C5B91_01095 [Haloferax sp. Atlit-10N]|uniref:hypothetical protein n=1 Tax=unclassified Haloferax TaxID=2625095 RepID=UPI000E246B4F|nr:MULTISPECIES: hypothetical protein [unclassified Haloferax]RDZ46300.1 hypothetical protein C5B87_01095 [Haloferax sp. Atlit-16N]RDZ60133.1 hypothetical protein C5B91_01095 [Haloferax sp. Atlit-10N]
MNRRALLLGTAGLCASLAGCASGDDAAASTETGTASPTPTEAPRRPRLVGRSFTPVRADACPADGALATETETGFSVVGCVSGATECTIARLARADYDADADTATLVVEAVERTDVKNCAESPVARGYEATLRFESGLPGRAVVVHDDADGRREVARVDADA